jgi:hypothetical protein
MHARRDAEIGDAHLADTVEHHVARLQIILGAKDLAHAAPAEQADDPVAFSEHGTRFEPVASPSFRLEVCRR